MANGSRLQAYLLLAAVVALWGINWPIMKAGLNYISPLWFATARVILGGGCLFALLGAQKRLRLPGRSDLPALLSVGMVQLVLTLAFIHMGLQYVEAGRSAILAYTTPLWVAPMAMAFLGERLGLQKLGGLALGLAGIGILFNPASFDFNDGRALLGNGLLISAAVGMAVVIVHMRRHRGALTPLQLMPWQMLLAGPLLALIAAVVEGDAPIRWSGALAAVLAYNGLVASAFCFWAYVVVMRNLPAVNTAMGSLGVPVVGVLASAIFLGEPLALSMVASLAVIAAGVTLVTTADLRKG